jgi:hypothetical protein
VIQLSMNPCPCFPNTPWRRAICTLFKDEDKQFELNSVSLIARNQCRSLRTGDVIIWLNYFFIW